VTNPHNEAQTNVSFHVNHEAGTKVPNPQFRNTLRDFSIIIFGMITTWGSRLVVVLLGSAAEVHRMTSKEKDMTMPSPCV
jgi:hypothetical protein